MNSKSEFNTGSFNGIAKPYSWLVMIGDSLQSIFLLVFRLYWGWQFFTIGQGKLFHHEKVAGFFGTLHIPFPSLSAWFVGGLECFGGLLLLVGLCSRPVALLLTISMTVAYLAVPADQAKVLSIFHNPNPFLSADPFFFWLTAVLVFCFGPGLVSLDALIKRSRQRELGTSRSQLTKGQTARAASIH